MNTRKKNQIPHKIHQIWVGPNPLPSKSKNFSKEIKTLHPNFKYKLWTDKDITPANFSNYKYIMETKSYAQKADIMRYEILYKEGGIYIDIDFQLFKNIEPLLTNELIVCHEDPFTYLHMSVGFIAATKHNPNLKRCVDNIKSIHFSLPINFATGPVYFRSNIIFNKNVTILDTNVLYPIHWFPNKFYSLLGTPKYTQNSFGEETYGIHHWNGDW
jgi:mannosyltransferase OCH1-like enzyme